ncbi:MAG: hypothetical protein V4501_07215 [Pseudomonadota bacterium]
MPLTFYPHDEDVAVGSAQERLEILMEAAERYKALVLDPSTFALEEGDDGKKAMTPKDLRVAFNWQEITKLLRELRELSETNQANKATKADRLTRLADVYEVLRGAKMSKLEAVRMAIMAEVKQLRSGGSSVPAA